MILSLIRIFLLISILKTSCTLDDIYKNCRDRERLIEPEKGDLYTLIDATLDQKLTLQCHYCGENDDGRPKIWYKIGDIGSPAPSEVDLDMNNNSTLARVHVNKEHSLIIHNFTENDTGLYYCERYEGEQQDKYNYLVDLIFHDNVTTLETGNITVWRKYHDEYFLPINMLFNHSEGVEFRHIREQLHVEMEMVTIWGPWGICQVCGRPKDEGIRKKVGYCRIKLTQKGSASLQNNTDLHFIKNANEIACRSKILGRILPGVSNLTRIIPNFVQTEACQGTCNPDAEGFSKGWKAGKTSAFKYRKIFVLAEGSHLTLVCPESTLENKVVWKKNGKVLEAGKSVTPPNPEDEPRIIVDTFNTLYLVSVKESEEGNYTCQVDDIRMQQIIIFTISKARILTQAFVRHMMYLGLVLSLTLPCYCAGLVIVCSKKRTYKNYEELKEEDARKHRYLKLT
ncbi:uncharacterized protein LOC103312737 isoform X1 [Tribolium castaneum]|nr:PREDICTED: uncharacterized protein LOC103312737 isoform X1 [Tribolium castaneum]|eukprot:XP_015834535.1 PREDICTED: uncharacterized protein LOC103312737 isoform X1 [Tribolium castaneum]